MLRCPPVGRPAARAFQPREAVIYTFGLIVSPAQTSPECALPRAALRRFEVINDGGLLIRLDGCTSVDAIAAAIRWLDAAGVSVHRVVELPTDSASAAHDLADAVNARLSDARLPAAAVPAAGRSGALT
jgi:hypothetical protein